MVSTVRGLMLLALRGKGCPEAVSMLPQASALRACAGSVAGFCGERWGSWTLLQPPEDLGSTLLVEAHIDELASAIIECPVGGSRSLLLRGQSGRTAHGAALPIGAHQTKGWGSAATAGSGHALQNGI
jgi:hypothetical protein